MYCQELGYLECRWTVFPWLMVSVYQIFVDIQRWKICLLMKQQEVYSTHLYCFGFLYNHKLWSEMVNYSSVHQSTSIFSDPFEQMTCLTTYLIYFSKKCLIPWSIWSSNVNELASLCYFLPLLHAPNLQWPKN